MRLSFILISCLALSQPLFSAASNDLLSGVIDVHAHCAPDSVPRSIDAIDLARLAKSRGMRGLVLKSHWEPTASLAYLTRKEVPGIEIFGGIDLNLSVGGMNPEAVERMAKITGGWGRFVWMSTFDSQAQVRFAKENRAFVAVARDGQLLPETKKVIAMIAKYHLILATGHNSPREDLLLIQEARSQGVRHTIVTHAMMAPIHMSIDEMKQAAGLGAFLEFVYNGLIGHYKEFTFADYAKAIQAVGAEHCILSSDMGAASNPLHPDGLLLFFEGLKKAGLTDSQIRMMSARNPALLLGL
ncbi:MAG TPA: DUF6282 family protein [Bryobacteraceae bacterium]|nr:DUF6282 family protein [Bryobacteraceae bacterium]